MYQYITKERRYMYTIVIRNNLNYLNIIEMNALNGLAGS